ncbi:unnamed protein product [Cuscuta europaea]|uniref:Uncharacterized protein n=1 Tax=Cuscuta europaea TaxID=41803 RepID=A0A9P0ZQJ7_CUSEU|nr:unnamed protein product [Cuscuta europaea]
MSSVPSSVETVNAAATAIVTAESRVQPTSIRKSGWGSRWSLYWCFSSYKHKTKRIGRAVLVPEPAAPAPAAPVVSGNQNHPTTTIVFPFIAPPSSPASFLQSDPPSAIQSPPGPLSLTAVLSINNAFSPSMASSAFTIGPYAHETQLVTPPAFSAVTTEPSTACYTPPPESAGMTTPPSPEVPFAQLLTSSLARNRRNNNVRFPLSQYDYQPYTCPGSPGSRFSARRWGSGTLTPVSRLGSGAMTPSNGGEPPSRDSYYVLDTQISEVVSLANSDNESEHNDDTTLHHRVSFELTGGEIPTVSPHNHPESAETVQLSDLAKEAEYSSSVQESRNGSVKEEEQQHHRWPEKHRSGALDLMSKDFDFNNVKPEVLDKSSVDCEWWTSVDYFPFVQPKVS